MAPKPWVTAADEAVRRGARFIEEVHDGYTIETIERDGKFDYETYQSLQEVGNKGKIGVVFANRSIIHRIADDAQRRMTSVRRVLCHGTRNGAEQRWFSERLPNAEILGTEISSTAAQFPRTIQWDFHDTKPEWESYWDVVYSNAWDHAYSPSKLFAAWASSLRPSGIMYLEHTQMHEPAEANHLDLFRASEEALKELVAVYGLIFKGSLKGRDRTVLVFEK